MRLRVLSVITVSSLFMLGLAFNFAPEYSLLAKAHQDESMIALSNENDKMKTAIAEIDDAVKNDELGVDKVKLASLVSIPLPKPAERVFTVKSGDSLSGILERASVSKAEAYEIVQAIKAKFDPRGMKVGQKIIIDTEVKNGQTIFKDMSVQKSQLDYVKLSKQSDANYNVQSLQRKFTVETGYANATIDENKSSLYLALKAQNVPNEIIAQMIKSYSWDVDFQRGIHKGDKIEILYEKSVLGNGDHVTGRGKMLYAQLVSGGVALPMYRYEKESGWHDFYNGEGRSIRKALLSTPVDGARISSGFGSREHPVLGYTKMHKGIDFAAARGTPIYAAGDGVIQRANWFSSYGRYVKIRHNGELSTAYAHMNGFAKGIVAGKRVKQGQVIGYIGTSGRSTGPHLHYEVLQNGRQVNPNSLKLPTGEKLTGDALQAFMREKAKIDSLRKKIQRADKERIALLSQ